MCGIIGIVGDTKNIAPATTAGMLSTLARRGPDDKGTLTFPSCILGQTRLSIIDLSSGHQPMKDNKRNIAITFNGEIYNYRELKKELEQKGYVFSTTSDTEVILKAYQEYGTECPKHLDGMFAFAIWDTDKQRLFAARDRFGKKPFYYCTTANGNFIFASEIKAIFASGLVKGVLNAEAIDNYLALMYVPSDKTIYENISMLAPAHSLIFSDGSASRRITVDRYWSLEHAPITISYQDAKTRVRELIGAAVKKRMIADVEIGALLSGGVDSTFTVYFAQEYSTHPIKTFSVGYGGHASELPYALEASRKFGTDHYTIDIRDNFVEEITSVIEYFDEPHADSSDFPQSMISKLAGSKVKVALSGDGADELFMGYGWYWKRQNLSWRHDLFDKLLLDDFAVFEKNIQIFNARERQSLWNNGGRDFVPDHIRALRDPIDRINRFDLEVYLPGQLLSKVDRAGMMHSLEVRCPFLDHHLAEFVYNLPLEYKVKDSHGKIILKDILADIMPRDFVYRRKQGFGAPVRQWLKEDTCKNLARDTLDTPSAKIFAYFDQKAVQAILRGFYEHGDASLCYKVWALLCLELWFKSHEQYIV